MSVRERGGKRGKPHQYRCGDGDFPRWLYIDKTSGQQLVGQTTCTAALIENSLFVVR